MGVTTVRFSAEVDAVRDGESVFVVGSLRSVGGWRTERGVRLTRTGTDDSTLWTVNVPFPPAENIALLEYKFVVQPSSPTRGSQALWIPGPNLTVKMPDVLDAPAPEPWRLYRPEPHPGVARASSATDLVAAHARASTHNQISPLQHPDPITVPDTLVDAKVPDWYKDAVFYHIYPLGTPGHGGGGFFGHVPEQNDGVSFPSQRLYQLRDFYPHLTQLGVTAVYFSPMFESNTHGYDTIDYFMIDRRIGDLCSFKVIVSELHDIGIRVVLDGVFNHVGRGHFAFQDVLNAGKRWKDSPYAPWFYLREGHSGYGDCFAYKSWEGHQELPKLNLGNEHVRNHIFAVAKFWFEEASIDGWRLDVAHEISPSFWNEFRRVCDASNPDHVLIGELIHGDYNKWVNGSTLLHSGTNYQLSKAIWSSVKEKNYFELAHSLAYELRTYKGLFLLNFVSNHDISRVASQLEELSKVTLAYAFTFFARGVPCIYYGDECGVRGNKRDGDAALRQKMPVPGESWPDREHFIYSSLAEMSELRRTVPALSRGTMASLENSNTTIAFLRVLGGQVALVALNCGDEKNVICASVQRQVRFLDEGAVFVDARKGRSDKVVLKGGTLGIELDPLSFRVLVASA